MDDTLLKLLELIFRSPADPEVGLQVFEKLAAAMSPEVRAVALFETPGASPSTLMFGANIERAAPGRLHRSKGPTLESLPAGAVFEVPRLGSAKSETARSLLEPEGLLPGPGLGIVVTADEGRATSWLLVLPRSESWTPQAKDRELMERIAPFVVHATRIHLRLLGASALTTLLDHLVLGVVLSDLRGRVSYVNQSAAEMLGVEPGESTPVEGAALDARSEALYRTIRPTDNGNGDGESLYGHPIDGRPLHILSTELNWPSWRGYSGTRFARALFIGDPKQGTGDPLGNLGQAYGLTTHEARLAALLVGDFTLAQAAEQLGITQNTARTVLKRIFAKTGTKRQASLIRLLLSGPGQIRPSGPGPEPNEH